MIVFTELIRLEQEIEHPAASRMADRVKDIRLALGSDHHERDNT